MNYDVTAASPGGLMFEWVQNGTVDEAISGLYYAIRLIRHRQDLIDVEQGIHVEGLESEPSLSERAIALRVVKEIEYAEDVRVENLGESAAEDYVSQLLDVMRMLAMAEFGCDKDLGRELLGRFAPALAFSADASEADRF